jgi:hypothetical protein
MIVDFLHHLIAAYLIFGSIFLTMEYYDDDSA